MTRPATKLKLEKPEPANGVFSYDTVIAYLENRYGFNQHNFSMNEHLHYDNWCDARGYTNRKKDPEGKHRSSSQIWFAEYRNDPEGLDKEPPVEDFWHWLLDFLGADKVFAKVPFQLPVGRMFDSWDTDVAPIMQVLYDKQNAAIIAGIERTVTDPEIRKQVLQTFKPKSATLPVYVKSILGYMRAEFGEILQITVPDRG